MGWALPPHRSARLHFGVRPRGFSIRACGHDQRALLPCRSAPLQSITAAVSHLGRLPSTRRPLGHRSSRLPAVGPSCPDVHSRRCPHGAHHMAAVCTFELGPWQYQGDTFHGVRCLSTNSSAIVARRLTSPTPSALRVSHPLSGFIPQLPRGGLSRHCRP